jgi:hypothetical protein
MRTHADVARAQGDFRSSLGHRPRGSRDSQPDAVLVDLEDVAVCQTALEDVRLADASTSNWPARKSA